MKVERWIRRPAAPVLAMLTLLAGCHRSAPETQKAARPDSVVVTVAVVTNVVWEQNVAIIGTLYPKDEATVAAQVEGQVEKTLVDFGDRVRSGQELALIDTASYEARLEEVIGNLAKAEAALTNARQNFVRVQKLRGENIASESDFDASTGELSEAEAGVKAARGTEAVAQLNLQRSRVVAPFDSAIARRHVTRGDYVQAGSPLFDIVNDSVLKFIFQVPERYASFVRKGLPVKFGVDNYPDESFTGSVYLISPSISTVSRAFNVGALVTNTDFRLKANTFARGSLVLGEGRPLPAVPVEAVIRLAGVTRLFVVEEGVARSRSVRPGRIQEGMQEILDGLQGNETVVISGQNRLTEGTRVSLRSPGLDATEPGDPAPPRRAGNTDHGASLDSRHASH